MVIYIKELDVLRTIFLKKEIIVRDYKNIFCEDTWSNFVDLRLCEFRAINIKSAGGFAEMRRCPI
jgi:hypothetical protein